jgi:hypothetical protein
LPHTQPPACPPPTAPACSPPWRWRLLPARWLPDGARLRTYEQQLFVVGLGLCIKVQPLRRFFRSGRPQRLKLAFIARYPKFYNTTREKVIGGAERLAASRLFRPIPEALGSTPKNFALGLAENIVLFKLSFPIHVGLQNRSKLHGFWLVSFV